MFCRDFSGAFLCTTNENAPIGNDDMALGNGGGGGGGGGGVGGGGGSDVDLATPPKPHDMAMAPPDLTPPPTNCTATSLIVNEVQTGSGLNEFIEIFNPCGNAVTAAGKLVYRAAGASSDSNTLVATVNKSVPAMGYLLFANSGYTGAVTPDYTYSNGLADGGGGVALRDASNNLVCSVSWGTANNGFGSGNSAPTEGTGKSIARKPNGANSHDDSADFASSTPTPGAAN
jgi:5'-nucleotidase